MAYLLDCEQQLGLPIVLRPGTAAVHALWVGRWNDLGNVVLQVVCCALSARNNMRVHKLCSDFTLGSKRQHTHTHTQFLVATILDNKNVCVSFSDKVQRY